MKRMVSEKRTQVYFPNDVYRKIERHAKAEAKSSAQIIREAVENFLKEKKRTVDWEEDPFLRAVGMFESDAGDLSEKHDMYLYGKKKRAQPK